MAWAITGGEPDRNRHPNVGAVIVYHPDYGVIPYCSGTLIHERVMLTAGHGVAPIVNGEVLLLGVSFAEDVDLTDPSSWLPIAWLEYQYAHRSSANTNGEDIGLIVLENPVVSVTPATLPTAGYLDDLKNNHLLQAGPNGATLTVVGYGFGLDWPPPQPVYPISADGKAERNMAQTGYLGLNDAWLNTLQNPAAGYGGTWTGDSGGPVLWTDPNTGKEVLVAITSWGHSLVGSSFNHRVDTAESLTFIQDVIGSLGVG
jgi:secreted trypsin-like serine protease